MLSRSSDQDLPTIDLVVIAGGASRRMGLDKALLPIPPYNTPLLRSIVERVSACATGQTIVVANDLSLSTRAGLSPTVRQVRDAYGKSGALGGLATGLAECSEWVLVLACDMPLINPHLIDGLCQLTAAHANGEYEPFDAIVPFTGGHAQPLHALYHRRCLPFIEAVLARGDLRVTAFYEAIRMRRVLDEEWQRYDPTGQSFLNVNRPDEWQQALETLAGC